MAEKKEDKYTQVVIWPGIIIGKDKVQEFEEWMNEAGFRVKYIKEFKTLPTPNEQDTGGRNDTLFYIHSEDIGKFAIWRLGRGMRWIEDAIDNEPEIYPEDVKNYKTW